MGALGVRLDEGSLKQPPPPLLSAILSLLFCEEGEICYRPHGDLLKTLQDLLESCLMPVGDLLETCERLIRDLLETCWRLARDICRPVGDLLETS